MLLKKRIIYRSLRKQCLLDQNIRDRNFLPATPLYLHMILHPFFFRTLNTRADGSKNYPFPYIINWQKRRPLRSDMEKACAFYPCLIDLARELNTS